MIENFELNFIGKQTARALANQPTKMQLSYHKQLSVRKLHNNSNSSQQEISIPQTDQNHFIEGDNLDVLKLLQTTYSDQVHTIYIDPPYNSGNDNFVYADSFAQKNGSPDIQNQQYPFYKNLKYSGQQHSTWLAMIYPRLVLARRLLRPEGVIFISIDEREVAHLKLLMDEIFGEENFIDIFNWAKTETPANLSKKSKKVIEYILCYQKQKNKTKFTGIQKTSQSTNGLLNQTNRVADLIFPKNVVQTKLKDQKISAGKYGTARYDIDLLADTVVKDGRFIQPVHLRAKFKWTQPKLDAEIARGTEIFIPTLRLSPSYEKSSYAAEVPPNLINMKVGVATNEVASKQLTTLLGAKVFDYPKPVSLLKYLLGFHDGQDAICLDFFAGSGTLAQAVWEMNQADGGQRKWICVQAAAACPAKSVAAEKGFKTITEIALKRIESIQNDEAFLHWKCV